MNRKSIKSALKRKFNEWVQSIDDEVVRKDVVENSIITGGAIVSMLLNEPPKDYDVYFISKNTAHRVAEYYIKKWNACHDKKSYLIDGANFDLLDNDLPNIEGLDYIAKTLTDDRIRVVFQSGGVASDDGYILEEPFEDVFDVMEEADEVPVESIEEKEKYRPVFLSPNAITLSGKIQIIIRFHGTAEEIHENYDFEHCKSHWLSDGGHLFLKPESLESILAKHLVYTGSKYPVCSVIRMRKFIKRGWHINAGQILKMLFQVSELDLTDISVLEDQLIGVDIAYFMNLIDALRKKMEKDSEFVINSGYITTIIDKIFG